jgi:hypothetical protein
MNESAILILLGVAGVLFHCMAKIKSLRDASVSANVKFNWIKDYVEKDTAAIIMSFLTVLIWFFTFGEVSAKYAIVVDFKRVSFVLAGIVGSYLVQLISDLLLNSAKKRIQKFVDIKTNISDITTGTGSGATIQEVINKGSKATGEDVTKTPVEVPKVEP